MPASVASPPVLEGGVHGVERIDGLASTPYSTRAWKVSGVPAPRRAERRPPATSCAPPSGSGQRAGLVDCASTVRQRLTTGVDAAASAPTDGRRAPSVRTASSTTRYSSGSMAMASAMPASTACSQ